MPSVSAKIGSITCQPPSRPSLWLSGWLAAWLVDWMTGWLLSWKTDWLIVELSDWLANWLWEQLADRLTNLLCERLIGCIPISVSPITYDVNTIIGCIHCLQCTAFRSPFPLTRLWLELSGKLHFRQYVSPYGYETTRDSCWRSYARGAQSTMCQSIMKYWQLIRFGGKQFPPKPYQETL